MKVLVVSNLYPPEFLGGYELGCSQMVEALRVAGHDVRVVTSVSAHGRKSDDSIVARVLELPPIYSPSRMATASPPLHQYFYLLSHVVSPSNVRALGEELEAFDPDVVYLWNLLGLGGLAVLALLDQQGVPWVWHLMDLIPRQLCTFGPVGRELTQEFGKFVSGRYVACSSHVLGEIRMGGVDLGETVYIVPNWVQGERPRSRRSFFTGGELRVMSASGLLSEAKGTDILIQAAARLRDLGTSNFRIDLYGYEQDPRFRALTHEYGVADKVRIMGPRHHDELLRLYALYDVFAFPTWSREPSAFAPLEAAAAGCVPLFTSDCGNAEWMIDGVDCLKASRTSEGFATVLATILRHEIDLGMIGRRAQAVAWREFHISAAAAKVEQVLAEATGDRRPPHGSIAEFATLAKFAEGLVHTLLLEFSQ